MKDPLRSLEVAMRAAVTVALAALLSACVTTVAAPTGVGSFEVTLQDIDDYPRAGACADAPKEGTQACPRPFPEVNAAVTATLTVRALDRNGQFMPSFQGGAQVDVRPGQVSGVGPAGLLVQFAAGEATVTVPFVHSFGPTRIWIEDCGASAAQSFATGVSPELWFDKPTIDQLNFMEGEEADNSGSPLEPTATNVCVLAGDPRYGKAKNEDNIEEWVGYSHGHAVNAPPPAMGQFVEIIGCSRAEYDAAGAAGCARGPLVVTGIGNEGFYISDLNPAAAARGFNHMYAFNFNYPDELAVGDVVLSLRGSPVEFAGSTQIGNPVWVRDELQDELEDRPVPAPITVTPATYSAALTKEMCSQVNFGGNRRTAMELEKLEGALVCLENLAPASRLEVCDKNDNGSIERGGCLLSGGCAAPLPLRCEEGVSQVPVEPLCDDGPKEDYCLPLSAEELAACKLFGRAPSNAPEYCCERACYADFACSEGSSYRAFGQWAADVFGRYDAVAEEDQPVKLAFITRDANPDFDPIAFGAEQRAKPVAERQGLRIIGNLRQVLAARPVWVVVARSPSDIEIGGSCP